MRHICDQIESSGFRGETYSSPAQHGMMDPDAFKAELAQHAKSFGGPLAALGELESGGDNAHAALLAEIVQRRTGTPSPSKRIEEMHPAALLREIEAVVSKPALHCQKHHYLQRTSLATMSGLSKFSAAAVWPGAAPIPTEPETCRLRR